MPPDWTLIAQALRAVSTTGEPAWPALQAALHGPITQLARYQPIGRLRDDIDTGAEVAVRVLAKLRANDFRAVRSLFATDQPPEPRAWLRVVVRSVAIDFMREHDAFVRGRKTEDARWISIQSLASDLGAGVPNSLADKRRELERFLAGCVDAATDAAASSDPDGAQGALALAWNVEPLHVRRLVTKGVRYGPVLELVLAGHSYPEVATHLGLSRREVELVISYIEELLRARHFGQ